MDEVKQMLRAVIHGQNALKQELLGEIKKLDKKIDNKTDGIKIKMERMEKTLTERIDKLGKQLAYLEDDAPTREEFNDLEKQVKDNSNQIARLV